GPALFQPVRAREPQLIAKQVIPLGRGAFGYVDTSNVEVSVLLENVDEPASNTDLIHVHADLLIRPAQLPGRLPHHAGELDDVHALTDTRLKRLAPAPRLDDRLVVSVAGDVHPKNQGPTVRHRRPPPLRCEHESQGDDRVVRLGREVALDRTWNAADSSPHSRRFVSM